MGVERWSLHAHGCSQLPARGAAFPACPATSPLDSPSLSSATHGVLIYAHPTVRCPSSFRSPVAYKRAVLNCIDYLSKFGWTKQQVKTYWKKAYVAAGTGGQPGSSPLLSSFFSSALHLSNHRKPVDNAPVDTAHSVAADLTTPFHPCRCTSCSPAAPARAASLASSGGWAGCSVQMAASVGGLGGLGRAGEGVDLRPR